MRASEASGALEWLRREGQTSGMTTGFDPDGLARHTWLLHAMYEHPALGETGSHDDVHRRQLSQGVAEPLQINGVDLETSTVLTGGRLGYAHRPDPPWTRVRWRSYLRDDLEKTSRTVPWPPSHRWFPPGSFPADVLPPPEGSMDETSWTALLQVLEQQVSGDTWCQAFFVPLVCGRGGDCPEVWQAPLRRMHEIVGEAGHGFSPTNMWPADRSWFVYTDYDLLATKVKGTDQLLHKLATHPDLETLPWAPPAQ